MLVVLQAMDAAGKDGVIKHVMSGINPQGCEVHPFKAPSAEELDHDFLWRVGMRLPSRGRIGIFNRSHYEEVLVVRVHPELLERQKLPQDARRQGHLEAALQGHPRLRAPSRPQRHAGRSSSSCTSPRRSSASACSRGSTSRPSAGSSRMGDVAERKLWDKYMDAYEDMIRATSRDEAPWYVVPADNKPFARLVVAAALIEALEGLDLQYPKVEGAALEEMQKVRAALLAEGKRRAARPAAEREPSTWREARLVRPRRRRPMPPPARLGVTMQLWSCLMRRGLAMTVVGDRLRRHGRAEPRVDATDRHSPNRI